MLEAEHTKRISARAALSHPAFRNHRGSRVSIMVKKTPRSIDKVIPPRIVINTNNNTNFDKYL